KVAGDGLPARRAHAARHSGRLSPKTTHANVVAPRPVYKGPVLEHYKVFAWAGGQSRRMIVAPSHSWRWKMSSLKIVLGIGVIAAASWLPARARDEDDIARALPAAPAGVASGAAVVRVGKDGSMTTLRPGTNGYTCLVMGPLPAMCADANSLEFMQAYM